MPSWPGQSSLQQHQPPGDSFTVPTERPKRPPLPSLFTLLPFSTLSRWTPAPLLCSLHSTAPANIVRMNFLKARTLLTFLDPHQPVLPKARHQQGP